MTTERSAITSIAEAAAAYVGRAVADMERQAKHERELREAQFAARIAELDARLAAVAQVEKDLTERLAAVKDGEPGRDGADGRDGASVSPDDVQAMVRTEADRILAGWERPQDGRSVSPDDLAPMIAEAVAEALATAIAGLPPAEQGPQGEMGPQGEPGFSLDDFDTELVEGGRTLLMKFVRGDTSMVHEIPLPVGPQGDPGEPGQSMSADDVVEMLEEMVAKAVGALPPAERGERGPEGPVGKLPAVSEWEDRVHYEGEVVTLDGSTFQAVRDTGKAPGHDDWRCIVAAGRDGINGRSPTVRATFDPSEAYRELDIVALNGAAFIARRDDPGPCPGDGWQLMSSQGKQGKPGDRGTPGPKGDTGHVRALSAGRISGDGLLTLVNADGSTVDVDLYPVLSQLG